MTNQLSLIVGGSTGMGRATAELLVSGGHTVFLVGRDEGKLESARDELSLTGSGQVETFVADLYDHGATDALIVERGAGDADQGRVQ